MAVSTFSRKIGKTSGDSRGFNCQQMAAKPPTRTGADRKEIFLIEDHPITREGFAQLLNDQPDFRVCGYAGSTPKALSAIDARPPDLVIVDILLAESSGLELIKQLRARHANLKVLVLSVHDEELYAERALRAGASGYIMKSAPSAEVMTAIRTVLAGGLFLSAAMHERLLHQHLQSPKSGRSSEVDCLSDRELEIFELLGRGESTRRISARLHLSISTIETHRAHIKKKLRVPNALELVRRAVGWVNRSV